MERTNSGFCLKLAQQGAKKNKEGSKSSRRLVKVFSKDEYSSVNLLENADMTDEISIIYWCKSNPHDEEKNPGLKTGASSHCFEEAIFELSVISSKGETTTVKLQLKDHGNKVLAANFSLGPEPFFEMISLDDPNYNPHDTAHEFEITASSENGLPAKYLSLKIINPQNKKECYFWHVDEETSDIYLHPSADNAMVFLTKSLDHDCS